jgi:hypothetical protein
MQVVEAQFGFLWRNPLRRLRKNSQMRAVPWESGASAPRKASRIGLGFGPCGRRWLTNGVFPQPVSANHLAVRRIKTALESPR